MSLIERAAKRLEELQRSGIVLREGAQVGATPVPERPPTPEALVQRLAERTPLPSAPATKPGSPNPLRPHANEARGSDVTKFTRLADIDLARLAQRGFVSPDDPGARIAQEFRVLKRPLIRNVQDPNIANANLIMVTSALPGEGKTFTAANLALSMAMEFDYSVLLVDGDVAHPNLPGVLGTPTSPGLLDLLVRDTLTFEEVVLRTNIDKLLVLPSGTRQPRATELLASDRMASLLDSLAASFPSHIILFDSPPLLATTEARTLATHMGQIVMAVAADSTPKRVLKQALATIEHCEVVLMMLNRATGSDVKPYGYYGDGAAS